MTDLTSFPEAAAANIAQAGCDEMMQAVRASVQKPWVGKHTPCGLLEIGKFFCDCAEALDTMIVGGDFGRCRQMTIREMRALQMVLEQTGDQFAQTALAAARRAPAPRPWWRRWLGQPVPLWHVLVACVAAGFVRTIIQVVFQ